MRYQILTLWLSDERFLFLKNELEPSKAHLTMAADMRMAVRLCANNVYHLIVAEVQNTEIFTTLLPALRRVTFAPIVLLTEKLSQRDAAHALKKGADLCLPADIDQELFTEYLLAQLRRYTAYNRYDQPESLDVSPIRVGDLMIDPIRYEVQVKGRPVHLRPREFYLLLYFMRNPGIVLSAGQICEHAWGMEAGYNQGVSQPVATLRRAIEPDPKNQIFIETVYRMGYRFTGCSTGL